MKHNNQHTIKKNYTKPVIEEVMIDREISIAMQSPDTDPGDDDDEWGDIDPQGVSPFEPGPFKKATSPFPDKPQY